MCPSTQSIAACITKRRLARFVVPCPSSANWISFVSTPRRFSIENRYSFVISPMPPSSLLPEIRSVGVLISWSLWSGSSSKYACGFSIRVPLKNQTWMGHSQCPVCGPVESPIQPFAHPSFEIATRKRCVVGRSALARCAPALWPSSAMRSGST